MPPSRITIIPTLHGKVTADHKLSEPDIYFILEKWLQRHPHFRGREQEMRISRGRLLLPEGRLTEAVRVTVAYSDEIAAYDAAKDVDLYAYFVAAHE